MLIISGVRDAGCLEMVPKQRNTKVGKTEKRKLSAEEILIEGAMVFGTSLSSKQRSLFGMYYNELRKWNQKVRLTSNTQKEVIYRDHFLDSLAALSFLRPTPLLDIGSGGGFPGIPLKIMSPNITVTLVDSTLKKVHFLKHLIRTLGLEGIHAYHQRVGGSDGGEIERKFDQVIVRAVYSQDKVLRLAGSRLAPGGQLILMKGRMGEEEIHRFGQSGKLSKFQEIRVFSYMLPFSNKRRNLCILTGC